MRSTAFHVLDIVQNPFRKISHDGSTSTSKLNKRRDPRGRRAHRRDPTTNSHNIAIFGL